MRNAAIVMAAILALVGAFILGTFYPRREPSPRAPVADAGRDLNYQKTCAEGAAAYFKSSNPVNDSNHTSGYTNHYNAKLGKCFILITDNDYSKAGTLGIFISLIDAFEGTQYGNCLENFDDTSKDTHALLCFAFPDGVTKKVLYTPKQWDDFADGMMHG